MENNISDRLMLVIRHLNLSINAFAKSIDVSQALLFNYAKGRMPSVTFIEKILTKYPEINIEWLITGKGEMLKSAINIGNINNAGNINSRGSNNKITNSGNIEVKNFTPELEKALLKIEFLEKMLKDKEKIIELLTKN